MRRQMPLLELKVGQHVVLTVSNTENFWGFRKIAQNPK